MLDVKLFRENPELVKEALLKREMDSAIVDEVITLDEQRRRLILDVESKKAERNAVSKEIGRMKSKEEREAKISAMRVLGDDISALDETLKQRKKRFTIPWLASPTSPTRMFQLDRTTSTTWCCARLANPNNSTLNPNPIGIWAPPWISSTLKPA